MRHALIMIVVVVAATTASVSSGHAVRWCLQAASDRYQDDCAYHSIAQCKDAGGNGAAPCYPSRSAISDEPEQTRSVPASKRPVHKRRH